MGFCASLILLTSTRFVKYTQTFMLDPFLALFLTWAGFELFEWLNGRGGAVRRGGVLGLSLATALLMKGVPALILVPVVLILLWGQGRRESIRFMLSLAIGGGVILLPWFFWLEGASYLSRYWSESVVGRATPRSAESLLAPSRNLLKQYWPWLVLWLWASVRWLRRNRGRDALAPAGIPFLLSWGILGGFSIAGSFLEHYLVPFYPFAALAIASEFSESLRGRAREVRWVVGVSTVVAAVLVLGMFVRVRRGGLEQSPFRQALMQSAREFPSAKILRISSTATELWSGLAAGLWYTPFDVAVEHPEALRLPVPCGELWLQTTEEFQEKGEASKIPYRLQEGSCVSRS